VALVKDLQPLFGDRLETIVVDNGSSPDASPYLRQARYFSSDRNWEGNE
jgi:hypothetical protein